MANAATEKSKERDGGALSQSRRAVEVEPSLGGRLQLSKNQTKVGIKKNLQSLNNTNANLNSSGMLSDKKMQNQLNSAVLGKQAGAVPKGPLPSQHNAQMLIHGEANPATALGKYSAAPAQNTNAIRPTAGKLGTLGSNSSLNMNFKNPQENSSCHMTQFNYHQSGHIQQNNQLSQDLFYGRYPHDETSNEHEHEYTQSPEQRAQEIINEDEQSVSHPGPSSQIQWTTIEKNDTSVSSQKRGRNSVRGSRGQGGEGAGTRGDSIEIRENGMDEENQEEAR